MDTVLDDLLWRGRDSFAYRPLCLPDSLVFSWLSYQDLRGLADGGKRITLRRACQRLLDREAESGAADPQRTALLQAIGGSERFGGVVAFDHVDIHRGTDLQFSATSFLLPDGQCYVSFRGTDDTIAGWKEDFITSFSETAGQRQAAAYLRRAINRGGPCLVGGHSKGGCLALFAALSLPAPLRPQVLHLYLHDSPGLCPEVFDLSGLEEMARRATLVLPVFSLVGRLFQTPAADTVIVPSTVQGIMQHNPLTWVVDHGELATAPAFDPMSDYAIATVSQWLEGCDFSTRRRVVEAFFSAMAADGSTTISQVAQKGVVGLERILVQVSRNNSLPGRQAAVRLPLTALFGSAVNRVRGSKRLRSVTHSSTILSLLVLLSGILLSVAPGRFMVVAVGCVLFAIALFEIAVTLRSLRECGWDFRREQVRVQLCVLLLAVDAAIVVKEQALFVLSSMIFGAVLLSMAYYHLTHAKESLRHSWPRRLHTVAALLYGLSGGFVLLSSPELLDSAGLNIGQVMVADGAIGLVLALAALLRRGK